MTGWHRLTSPTATAGCCNKIHPLNLSGDPINIPGYHIHYSSFLHDSETQAANCFSFITAWMLWPLNKQMVLSALLFCR